MCHWLPDLHVYCNLLLGSSLFPQTLVTIRKNVYNSTQQYQTKYPYVSKQLDKYLCKLFSSWFMCTLFSWRFTYPGICPMWMSSRCSHSSKRKTFLLQILLDISRILAPDKRACRKCLEEGGQGDPANRCPDRKLWKASVVPSSSGGTAGEETSAPLGVSCHFFLGLMFSKRLLDAGKTNEPSIQLLWLMQSVRGLQKAWVTFVGVAP